MPVKGFTLHLVTRNLSEADFAEFDQALCAGDVIVFVGDGIGSLAMIGANQAAEPGCQWFVWKSESDGAHLSPWPAALETSQWAELVAASGRTLTWGR